MSSCLRRWTGNFEELLEAQGSDRYFFSTDDEEELDLGFVPQQAKQ
jgi:hypothetical protein